MGFKTVNIRLSTAVYDILRKQAEARAESLSVVVREILREGAEQLGSVEKQPGLVGRPAYSEEMRRVKELERQLTPTFTSLKRMYEGAYEGMYGALEQKYRNMLETKDLVGLEEFNKLQPWIHKTGV